MAGSRDLIAAEMSRTGGLITAADLAGYAPLERPALTGTYRGYRIVSMGPPSSGGVALLAAAEHPRGVSARRVRSQLVTYDASDDRGRAACLSPTAPNGSATLHSSRVPVDGPHRQALRRPPARRHQRDAGHAQQRHPRRAGHSEFESSQTTHYSVVDADGNAVSTTTTLNGGFGSGQVVTGAGFLLNNEMDDFSVKPGAPNMFGLVGGDANAVAPGQADAELDDADHRRARRPDVAGRRQPGRRAHHHDGAAGAGERRSITT